MSKQLLNRESNLLTASLLADSASLSGIGVHSGLSVEVRIHPAPQGAGVRFVRTDLDHSNVPARWDTVVNTQNCTTIGNQDGITVSTIEHLMAAFAIRGIDDAIVEVDGPEMPILDGSAAPFLDLIDRAGVQTTPYSRPLIRILKSIQVEGDDGRKARLEPADEPSFCVKFSFHNRVNFPDQETTFLPLSQSFDQHIGPARTFGLLEDADKIKALGLAKGASLENTVVFDKDHVVNPDGLRFEDECARHKILDAIGDLHLAGGLILGKYSGVFTGHTLNNQLLRELFSDASAYEVQ